MPDRERQDPRHAHNDRYNGYLRRQIETATARVHSLNECTGHQTAQAGSLRALVTRTDAWLGENAHATLGAEPLAVERDKEAFLRMALAQGVTIERRPDADPRAVLQVAVQPS